MTQRYPWIDAFVTSVRSALSTLPWIKSVGAGVVEQTDHSPRALGRGVVLALAAVIPIAALLASADAVFFAILSAGNLPSAFSHVGLTTLLLVPAAFFVVAGSTPTEQPVHGPHLPIDRFVVEGKTVVWSMVGLLGIWCALQIVVATGGARTVLETQGLKVAEYAREGFFQLVAVAAIVLAIVNGIRRIGHSGMIQDAGTRRAVAILGLELAMLVVATFARLSFYMSAFGLSMLRLSVSFFLGWLMLMTLIVVGRALGWRSGTNWTPPATILTLAATVLCFSLANPEAMVVRSQLENESAGDIDYILTLSHDAKRELRRSDHAELSDNLQHWSC